MEIEVPGGVVMVAATTMSALENIEAALVDVDCPFHLFGMLGIGERDSEFGTGWFVKWNLEDQVWQLLGKFDEITGPDDPDPGEEHDGAGEPIEAVDDPKVISMLDYVNRKAA